jgi:hypothetical protein
MDWVLEVVRQEPFGQAQHVEDLISAIGCLKAANLLNHKFEVSEPPLLGIGTVNVWEIVLKLRVVGPYTEPARDIPAVGQPRPLFHPLHSNLILRRVCDSSHCLLI